ncbi:MAG TPA: carboxypeptidase regulatory-like domain-containing protein, partial [Longimicrobiaceae bacterium]
MSPQIVRHGTSVPLSSRRRSAVTRLAFVATALLAIPCGATGQQTGSVDGRVVDRDSGAPLAGVALSVVGQERTVLSALDGRFRISSLPAGVHEVVARGLGFGIARASVAVNAGGVTRLEIALATEALLMPGVVVSTTREVRRLAETAATVGVISGDEIADTRPTHPSEVMQRIPGVWVAVTAGEGHTTAIRMPKTTEPVYLYLEDGVPTRSTGFFNHNALYEVN